MKKIFARINRWLHPESEPHDMLFYGRDGTPHTLDDITSPARLWPTYSVKMDAMEMRIQQLETTVADMRRASVTRTLTKPAD